MTIVIADDEELIRYEIRGILEELISPCIIHEAENADQLEMLCRSCLPDVAFVDVKMPGRSGIQAIEHLAAQDLPTQFVILSGHGEFELAKAAIHLGVKEYLLKPANRDEISAVLAALNLHEQSLVPRRFGSPAGSDALAHDVGTQVGKGGERSLATIRQAEQLIRDHFEQSIGVSEIAAMLDISPNYLSSQFKRWRNISFTQYITSLRMERAKQLLLEPGARVSQVARRLGYGSSRYFSRLFHQHVGLGPSDFIAKHA